jgi:hypothetical protein
MALRQDPLTAGPGMMDGDAAATKKEPCYLVTLNVEVGGAVTSTISCIKCGANSGALGVHFMDPAAIDSLPGVDIHSLNESGGEIVDC